MIGFLQVTVHRVGPRHASKRATSLRCRERREEEVKGVEEMQISSTERDVGCRRARCKCQKLSSGLEHGQTKGAVSQSLL
jgi:hypothetical protein